MSKKQRKTPSVEGRRSGNKSARWGWIAALVLGVFFVTALGISTSKPDGHGWMLSFTLWTARHVASITGDLSMYLCFLVILTSLFKLAKPVDTLPRPIFGLWLLLLAGSALWHDIKIPWDNTFQMARMGSGGGFVGAALDWFLRVSIGRFGAMLVFTLGIWSSLCMLASKSAYTPFSLLWILWLTAWRKVQAILANLFRAHGPHEEDIEYGVHHTLEAVEPHGQEGVFQEEEPVSPFAAAVTEIQERLSRPETPDIPSGWESQKQENLRRKTADNSIMEQLPLSEDFFYELPPLDILQKSGPRKRVRDTHLLENRARTIEKTLLSFGIASKVVHVTSGPAATRFELQPGPGVKVSSIVNLSQDLALALAAHDVRIEAPIPGKSAVGIEVPNKDISVVHIRDVFESREFKTSPSPLTVALGKDISGRPVVTNLDKCVHLLIAGATGTGKSVCINAIITSILFKSRPDTVKLLLIDPKRVELSAWTQIPHLVTPVVTDPKKASSALRWVIKEMESRYEKFTKVGTRDIERYNEIATPPGSLKPALPYIVVIIDELSDLMIVAPAEVEDSIFRLAQMARAAGIHLVVATQRPSVDVITGTIKANIPSRIAFAVSSQIDSRTILDMAGAEKLLGRGDMLFFPVGAVKPLRAQGSYLSEREIDELVSFTSGQAKPQYIKEVLAVAESAPAAAQIQEDPFFSQALRIVVEAKQASVSLLQRRLPIGYSRAARLIDAMELKGYIGPYDGSKPRDVKISIVEYLRLFESESEKAGPSTRPQAKPEQFTETQKDP